MFPKKSEKTALVSGKEHLSYNHLIRHINLRASSMHLQPGDRVLLFAGNSKEWIFTFYAIWLHRAIPVPVDFMSTAEDIAFIIDDCAPAMACCSKDGQEMLTTAMQQTRHQPKVMFIDDDNGTVKDSPEIAYASAPDETAVIIYTSGTTGTPKGVQLSFDNLLANIEAITEDVPIYSDRDRVMILLPLHHIFPLMGSMIIPLYAGGMVAIAPGLNPEDILTTLQDNKITLVIGVPRFYNMIIKGIRAKIKASPVARMLFHTARLLNSKGFSRTVFRSVHAKFGGSVRYLVSGGAALDVDVARDFLTLGFEVLEGYGMTESAPMITFSRPGYYRPGSVGQAIPATEIKIRGGEILARGRNIMQGYYNRPGETADVLRQGWLHTGDLGTIDESGFVTITGRKKEILVTSNGKNINPELLEKKILDTSPYIQEAGVFLKNDILQALLVADLHKMQYDGIDDYFGYARWQIIDKLNQQLAPYKRILKFYLTTEELPKTRLGKIQRFKLEEIADGLTGKRDRKVEEPDFPAYIAIRDYLTQETGNPVFPNDHLEMDLALDSLGKITLLVFIENTFGVRIPEEEFLKHHTVSGLSEYVRDKKTRSRFEVVNWKEILQEKVAVHLPKAGLSMRFFTGLSRLVLNLYFRMKGRGHDIIPEGPCIIAPNHQSFFDGFFIASLLRQRVMRNTYVYAKEKHWRKRWLRFLASRNNIILMDINRDLRLSLQKMAEALRRGKNIIIFPEGTRSKDGSLGSYKKTFAILSRELKVPVIPVAISGSFKALPSGAFFPRPFQKISVTFLQPVYPGNHSYDSLTKMVRDRVAQELSVR